MVAAQRPGFKAHGKEKWEKVPPVRGEALTNLGSDSMTDRSVPESGDFSARVM
jgi:hypothetical protein